MALLKTYKDTNLSAMKGSLEEEFKNKPYVSRYDKNRRRISEVRGPNDLFDRDKFRKPGSAGLIKSNLTEDQWMDDAQAIATAISNEEQSHMDRVGTSDFLGDYEHLLADAGIRPDDMHVPYSLDFVTKDVLSEIADAVNKGDETYIGMEYVPDNFLPEDRLTVFNVPLGEDEIQHDDGLALNLNMSGGEPIGIATALKNIPEEIFEKAELGYVVDEQAYQRLKKSTGYPSFETYINVSGAVAWTMTQEQIDEFLKERGMGGVQESTQVKEDESEHKFASDFEVIDHGIENSQYLRPMGASPNFEASYLGAGDTYDEALDDAIQQAFSAGWSMSTFFEEQIRGDQSEKINPISVSGMIEDEIRKEIESQNVGEDGQVTLSDVDIDRLVNQQVQNYFDGDADLYYYVELLLK